MGSASKATYGFAPDSLRTLRALKTPARIQNIIDEIPYQYAPRLVASARPSRAQGTLPRRRTRRGMCSSRQWVPTAPRGPRSGPRRRSRSRRLSSKWPVGKHCQIQLCRTSLSRSRISHHPRTSAQLRRSLLQSSRRTHPARLFTPCESRASGQAALDDVGRRCLVRPGTSYRGATLPTLPAQGRSNSSPNGSASL